MARLRTRAKRSVLLAMALALLALLLELNQFLPGTWPGGDAGGNRVVSDAGPREDDATTRKDDPDQPQDAHTVKPPEDPPADWPPKTGIPIELRSAQGSLETSWRLGIGDGGAEDGEPNPDGRFRSRDRRILEQGFRIRSGGRLLRHRHGLEAPATRWTVFRPEAELPPQRRPSPVELTVVEAGSREPLADVQVELAGMAKPEAQQTDEAGRVELRGAQRAGMVQATLSRPGFAPRTISLATRDPQPPILTMDRVQDLPLQIVTAEGAAAPVSEGYVIRPEQAGTTKFQGDRPTIRVREQELAQTWLEVHVVVDPDRRIEFPFRTRLSPGVTAITVPAHRVLPVSVRDPQGRPVADAIVRATYRTTASASGEDEPVGRARSVRTDARGRAHVAVPVMSSYDVVIEPPNGAPLVRRFPRGDGTAPFQVVTQPGVFVPIRVVGPGGAALAKAQVVARASMAETRITRTATTDDRGRAALGPFPEGPLEIFAKADGHAWAGRVETAVGAMGTVTLTCPIGYDLRIVVADPFGLPLEGVRAEVTAGDGGRPLVTSPLPEAWHTDAQGILHIPGLPNRTYDVTLTREGYGVEKLRGLQPGATTSFATLVRTPR